MPPNNCNRQHIWLYIISLAKRPEKPIGHFFVAHRHSPDSDGLLMSRHQIKFESFWKFESDLEVAAKPSLEDVSHAIFAVLFN